MKTEQEKTLMSKLKKLKGKVKYIYSRIFTHARIGRRTDTTAIMKIAGKYYFGTAELSKKDTFDRKMGRTVSLGRAFKNYVNKKNVVPEEHQKFKEDRK